MSAAACVLILLLAPSSASAVRAMTWNIAGGASNDATGPRAIAAVAFNADHVRTVIARYSPDVLALQEACGWQVDQIAAALGYTAHLEPSVRGLADPRPGAGGNCDYGDAVLYRAGSQAGGGFRTDLMNPRECKSGGLLLGVAECRVNTGVLALIGGAWVRATSAHVGGSHEDYQGAGNQTTQVATVVEDASRQESSALMMGDYNIPPQHARLAPRMAKLGYLDAGGSTPGQLCEPADGCLLTSPSGGAFGDPFLKGDYIYHRGYRLRPGGMHATGSALVNGVPASDHLPLIADLEPILPVVALLSPSQRSATTNPLPVLSGAVSGGDGSPVTVTLYSGTTTSGQIQQSTPVTPGSDGSWSVQVLSPLVDGVYTARAELRPGVYSSTNTFVVDHSPPSTFIADPQAYTSTRPTFILDSSEPDSWPFEPPPSYECALDAGEWEACHSPARFSNVPEGPHTFRTRSTDAGGNVDLLGTTTSFIVDGTPPQTTITTPVPELLATGAYIAFASNEANPRFRCQLDNATLTGCTPPKVFSRLAPGRHTFRVYAVDIVGNTDPQGAALRWETAPVLRTLRFSPASFIPVARGRRGGGTTMSFAFSGHARVRLLFERARTGVRIADGTCAYAPPLAQDEAPAGPGCVRWVERGTTTGRYGDTELTQMRLAGRLLGAALASGRYRITATPVDPGGRKGRPLVRRVTIRAIPRPVKKVKKKKPSKRR